MTELTDSTNAKPDLTSDEKDLLRKAGASEILFEVCDFDCTEVEDRGGKVVTRNSALQEAKKYVRGGHGTEPWLTEDNAEDFNQLGGDFFTALWEGELFKAYGRADGNNKPIMLEVFGLHRINRDRPPHRNKIKA